MTNEEKIKTMNIEELAKFFGGICLGYCCEACPAQKMCHDYGNIECAKIIEQWLKMEVRE